MLKRLLTVVSDTTVWTDSQRVHRCRIVRRQQLAEPDGSSFYTEEGRCFEMIIDCNWFHSNLDREAAESLLITEGLQDGLFLVRSSQTAIGDFALSVVADKKIVHYQIQRHGCDAFFSVEDGNIVHGLDALVEGCYIEWKKYGIATKLVTFVRGTEPPPETKQQGKVNLLHRAVREGNVTVVTELVRSGYKGMDAKDSEGQVALHVAAQLGKLDILKKLLDGNASINVRDSFGYTPLHYACMCNRADCVSLLLRYGANPQVRRLDTGYVPLHEAAFRGYIECCKKLLDFKAAHLPRTLSDEVPSDLARKSGHYQCARFLELYVPPVPSVSKSDWYHGGISRTRAQELLLEYADQHCRLTPTPDRSPNTSFADNLDHVNLNKNDDTHKLLALENKVKNLEINLNTKTPQKPTSLSLSTPSLNVGGGDGCFLVRKSNRRNTSFVLSVVFGSKAYHFEIKRRGQYYHIDDSPYLLSLEHLVGYFSRWWDGLSCVLTTGVPPIRPVAFDTDVLYARCTYNLSSSRSSSTNSLAPPLPERRPSPKMNRNSNTNLNGNSSTSRKKVENSYAASVVDSGSHPLDDIPVANLEVQDILGEGEFAFVYRGVYRPGNGQKDQNVALKVLQLLQNQQEFLREAQLMMKLDHPYIVKLIGVSKGPPLQMVEELVPMGSMIDYLVEHPTLVSPDFEIRLWASQIANGMMYFESKRFVHRDLAARNILLSTKLHIKISDFGLSRAINHDEMFYQASQGGRWPIKWYAPESYSGVFSHKSDIWSFGVTAWEMFSYGASPYGAMTGNQVIGEIQKGSRLPRPVACSEENYQMLLRCWSYKPEKRPTFKELYDFFSECKEYSNVQDLINSNLSVNDSKC